MKSTASIIQNRITQLSIWLFLAALPSSSQTAAEPVVSKLSSNNHLFPARVQKLSEVNYRMNLDRQIIGCLRHLERLKTSLPSASLVILTETDKLSNLCYDKGMYAVAGSLYAQGALESRRVLGAGHPHTVGSCLNLIDAMIEAGEYHIARRVQSEIHARVLKHFGPDCELAVRSMLLMSDIYHFMDWGVDGENVEREALKISLKQFGIRHGHTRKAMGNLAITLLSKSNHKNNIESFCVTSEELLRSAIQLDEELYDESPQACRRLQQLSSLLRSNGEHDESIALIKKLLRVCVEKYGSDHPITLEAVFYLGIALHDVGKYERSVAILKLAVLGTLREFGPNYKPATYRLEALAESLIKLEYWEEAACSYEEVYRYYEKDYDISHERELRCTQRLRDCYRQQGLYSNDSEFEDRLYSIVKTSGNTSWWVIGNTRKWCRV